MAQFDKIDAPYQFKEFWSKYPHGYTIYEALLDWVSQVNDMVGNVNEWNTYLTGFVAQFDENLQQEVTTIVQGWIDDGTIDVIISEALQTQIDTVEASVLLKADKTELTATKEQAQLSDIILPAMEVSNKLIQNAGGVFLVVTRKPNKKGYMRFKLREGVFTTSESFGSPAEFFRIIEVYDVEECFNYQHAGATYDDPAMWTTGTIAYTLPSGVTASIPSHQIVTRLIGRYIEFSVNVEKNQRDVECLFLMTGGSTPSMTVNVNGVAVLTGISLVGTGTKKVVVPVTKSGVNVLRFIATTFNFMTIAGVNLRALEESYNPNNNTHVTLFNGATKQWVNSNGSMDYALYDGDTNQWVGSYHGGETRSSLVIKVDNVVTALDPGVSAVGKIIDIEQVTNIASKINTQSIQRFAGDGSCELTVVFDGDINLKRLFTNMSTTRDSFNRVIYPIIEDMSAYADGDRVYLPQGINLTIQQDPTTNQKAISVFNRIKLPADADILPYIRKTVGAYNKVYSANIDRETSVNFKTGAFKTLHIFE